MHDAMRAADPSGGLEKCWQAKEMLRDLLALAGTDGPDRSLIWQRLTDFYTHCADSEIAPAPTARVDRERLAALDHRRPDHRHQQRPHRGLQPDRQARRTDRVRVPEHRRTRNAGYDSPAPAHHAGRQPEPSSPVNSEDPSFVAELLFTSTRQPDIWNIAWSVIRMVRCRSECLVCRVRVTL